MTAIAGRMRSTGFSVIGGSDLEQALTDQGMAVLVVVGHSGAGRGDRHGVTLFATGERDLDILVFNFVGHGALRPVLFCGSMVDRACQKMRLR